MNTKYLSQHEKGFTLVELLISIVAAAMLLGSLYIIFKSQNKTYQVQTQLSNIQRNTRMSIELVSKEIRMAGFNPKGTLFETSSPILSANATNFTFEADFNGDGVIESNEKVGFGLKPSDDTDGNGVADDNNGELTMTIGSSPPQVIATNVEAICFAYAFTNTNGNALVTASGHIIWAIPKAGTWYNLDTNGDGTIDQNDLTASVTGGVNTIGGISTGLPIITQNIRAVRIWILVRSEHEDSSYRDQNVYVVGDNIIKPTGTDIHYRHRLIYSIIKLRNMGLNY